MFVRKKKNRSGTTSIVVVDKHGGKFKEIHTVGIAHNDDEINSLCAKGRQWINNHLGIQVLDFDGFSRKEKEVKTAETMLENIDTILLNGAKLIIDKVYDSIGFIYRLQQNRGRDSPPISSSETVPTYEQNGNCRVSEVSF